MRKLVVVKRAQNDISRGHLSFSNHLDKRINEIVVDIAQRTEFIPEKIISKSSWWGSRKIGAFHYQGTYQNRPVVLKVQGFRPNLSEADMINFFAQHNRSWLIRPPHLYAHLKWNSQKKYEALIMEPISGPPLVSPLASELEISDFFQTYLDYRQNCLGRPWVDLPSKSLSNIVKDNFSAWRQSSFKIYPYHPFRDRDDVNLIDQAISILTREYKHTPLEFMHGHFSANDLYRQGEHIVLLSNLYWSWRAPFYDAIFAYHWAIYHLCTLSDITPKKVESQRQLWFSHIHSLPTLKTSSQKKLLTLALLERAAAGLNLDALTCDPKQKISKYLVDSTRSNLKQLLDQFS